MALGGPKSQREAMIPVNRDNSHKKSMACTVLYCTQKEPKVKETVLIQ